MTIEEIFYPAILHCLENENGVLCGYDNLNIKFVLNCEKLPNIKQILLSKESYQISKTKEKVRNFLGFPIKTTINYIEEQYQISCLITTSDAVLHDIHHNEVDDTLVQIDSKYSFADVFCRYNDNEKLVDLFNIKKDLLLKEYSEKVKQIELKKLDKFKLIVKNTIGNSNV